VRSEELPDLDRGGFTAPVEVSDWNVRMLFDGEQEDLELHETFRLGEVIATGELSAPFALSPRCAPPLLALQGHPPLHDEVCEDRLADRGEGARGGGTYRNDVDARPTAHVDALHARAHDAGASPPAVHGRDAAVRSLHGADRDAGALAAFRSSEAVELPLYKHDDLYACFHELIVFLDAPGSRRRCRSASAEIELPFDTGKEHTRPPAQHGDADPRNAFFLGVKAPPNITKDELVTLLHEQAKASSVAA
jgi:hypothetical protein